MAISARDLIIAEDEIRAAWQRHSDLGGPINAASVTLRAAEEAQQSARWEAEDLEAELKVMKEKIRKGEDK